MGNDQKKGRRFFFRGRGAADFQREERSTGGGLTGRRQRLQLPLSFISKVLHLDFKANHATQVLTTYFSNFQYIF